MTLPVFLGLTGSIGMGKSTTARMFEEQGVPVHDADATVHRLYAGRAAPAIEAAFPGTVIDGTVDRARLSKAVLGNAEAMKRLEAIIHPMVGEEERAFRAKVARDGAKMAVLDIPLLFETGGEDRVDAIVVVTAPADVQSQRVLARPGMTPEKFDAIRARQVPDPEKRARADFLVDTSKGMDAARDQVANIIAAINGGHWEGEQKDA